MNEGSLNKIDNVIDALSDAVLRWADHSCPHHLNDPLKMVYHSTARAYMQKKMANNLVIVDSFESPDAWCFGLGLINDDGEVMPLMGDSTIRISKETGEME